MRFRFPVRFWLAGLLVCFAAGPVFAQTGTVTGVVRSMDRGAPLISAVVQLTTPDGGRVGSSLTNQTGRYQITSAPPGTYTVVVSITGYETGRQQVTVAAGETAAANFDLASRAIDLDPVVVSASRQEERALDAPARTEVVSEQEIEVRPTVTPADHLRSVPGVDIATSGVQSTNVVARGFNNVFSGGLYMLSDHRIAGVPSLRVNLMHFVPTTNEDLERIEVVLGPGSALYGPGTANGVLHMLTRSPLTSQGTTLSLIGGERSLLQGSFRTAHLVSDDFGIKLSGQYMQADEWEYRDPVEQAELMKFQEDPQFWRADMMRASDLTEAQADARIANIANRDFDVERWGGELRADWRIAPNLTTVFSAGTNTSNGIELTGLGAGQAEDWRYSYYQLRANWNRAFGQVYVNTSDAGDTYLLRNGAPIRDRSSLFVAQLQNGADLWGGRQDFIYGLDFIRTLPVTEGTINGIYEDEDETTEFGGYIQSETALGPQFDLVLAGRIDTHSALPEAIFSPRAALVFKPSQNQSFRLSFNRAFSTPTSLTQFLDLGTAIPSEGAARLGYSVRVQGTGDRGFDFAQPDGSYLMRSPFTQFIGIPSSTLLPASQARAFWPVAIQVAATQSPMPAELVQYLSQLTPASVQLNYGAPETNAPQFPLSSLDLDRIEAIREETSNTLEAGYKGILGERVLLAA
ncbi:MAG: TonB-dependent receptor, partial [Gemmatimonadota bacterium]